jgi:hypothetical protein
MNTIAKCAAIASVVMLTAGGAAWAQSYGPNQGFSENQGLGPNQGFVQNQGFRGNMGLNPAAAQNELSRYGYTDIHNLQPMQGWSADAMENGQMVHVLIGENGRIATFHGVNESRMGETNGGLQNRNIAENRLGQYGYDNIHNTIPIPGWSADAKKNGEWVHVLIDTNGRIATFPGVQNGNVGSSGPSAENSQAGGNTYVNPQDRFAEQQLSRYGYSDIQNLQPTEGWSADATKNGEKVHVILGDRGIVATFRGLD